ncbi:MAG: alpha/beta hydrolase [Bryobacteraceae bacterium]
MPLDPQVKAHLERCIASGIPPRGEQTIAQTREFYRQARELAGEPAALPKIENGTVHSERREIPIRLYRPHSGDDLPVLLYLHGGRFISGDLETHDPVCRSLARLAECVVVAVDYRLAPEHRFPAALEDCYAVAVSLGNGCAVCGDSAGGGLAAALTHLARRSNGPWFRAQVLIYPMLDASRALPSHIEFASGYGPSTADMQRGYHEYAPDEDAKNPMISPLYEESLAGLPPTLVVTAEYDPLRDEGEEYARRLREAGVPVEWKRYDGAIHGFFQMGGILDLGKQAIDKVAGYLRRCWREA